MVRRRDLRAVLFESSGARRFTQDSPVLPDVWLAYGQSPGEPQDLLLTPHHGHLGGRLANELRGSAETWRNRKGAAIDGLRVAQLPGIVAVTLGFEELLHVVLPRTRWWKEQLEALSRTLSASGDGQAIRAIGPAERKWILRKLKELQQASTAHGAIARKGKGEEIPLGLAWLVGVVAFLISGHDGEPKDKDYRSALDLLLDNDSDGFTEPVAGEEAALVGRVALNRPTEAAITESALAVKADAARLLFNVSCKNITWAIIDSGIDAEHPAFESWDDPLAAPRSSRVIDTYDLTLVRTLLDPRYIDGIFNPAGPLTPQQQQLRDRYVNNLQRRGMDPANAPALALQLRDRLQNGLEMDWDLVEPFLKVPDPDPPVNGHGTHVAGIIAADWRENKAAAGDPPQWKVRMQGICPDIRLIDMRVLDREGRSQEFEVIAALQLIRHLNDRGDRRVVHGANLSLSTPHDVTAYACGSTLVCQECDRTWASGVVLVAAAGNRGHERYALASGEELGGYHNISITDPGNADGVITVGATHRVRPHQYGVSYFSSRGPTGDGRIKPDLVAPGERIDGPLPNGGLGTSDGTSLAAPHVSGAAAMLMARHGEFLGVPQRVKQILCGTATDLGRERYFQGAGMLDILRALQSI